MRRGKKEETGELWAEKEKEEVMLMQGGEKEEVDSRLECGRNSGNGGVFL